MGWDNYPLVVYKNHLECSRMFVMFIETNYIIDKNLGQTHRHLHRGVCNSNPSFFRYNSHKQLANINLLP